MNQQESRCWGLYNLLMAAPDKWWTQREIVDNVEGYSYLHYRTKNDKCPMIREDVLWINNNVEFKKIVVVDKYRYKIATKEEARAYYKKRINRLKTQVEMIKDLEFKMLADGHYDFLEKEWHESYYKAHGKFLEELL